MKVHFSLEEVKERNAICSKCVASSYKQKGYCNKHKTDSIVFLVERCKQLEKLKDE